MLGLKLVGIFVEALGSSPCEISRAPSWGSAFIEIHYISFNFMVSIHRALTWNFTRTQMHPIEFSGEQCPKLQAPSALITCELNPYIQYGPVTMIVPASGHQVSCIRWVQMGTFNNQLFMWIKILCIVYILWGIPTIESTFVANMMKTATLKDVPINNEVPINNDTGLLNSCLGKW